MKIQLKRSNVLDNGAAKEPSPQQMEFGEIAVNYNQNDPTLFIKDSAGEIIGIRPVTQNDSGVDSVNGMTGEVVLDLGVLTVNGKKGNVTLDADDVGALPDGNWAEYTSAASVQDTDEFILSRSNTAYRVTAATMKPYFASGGGGGGGGDIPSGTKMLFYMNSAPTGWTLKNDVDNGAIRVVASNGGTSAGVLGFTNAFRDYTLSVSGSASGSTDSASVSGTLSGNTEAVDLMGRQNGIHTHVFYGAQNASATIPLGGGNNGYNYNVNEGVTGKDTQAAGQGQTHQHSVTGSFSAGQHSHSFSNLTVNGEVFQDLRVKYADVTICQKN